MAIQLLELDINQQSIPAIGGSAEQGLYRILVRASAVPLGWVEIKTAAGEVIGSDEIKRKIHAQIGPAVMQSAILHSLQPRETEITLYSISIIVCTRDRTENLAHCLEALQQLEYPSFEIIVVDNAPATNATQELTEKLAVRYVREDRPGLDWARNRGINEARFTIIAFTDDDVIADRYWLQSLNRAFQNEAVMAVTGYVAPAVLDTDAQMVFELNYGGMGHGFRKKYFWKQQMSTRSLIWASNFGVGANMAFRKSLFEKTGGFDTALDVGTASHGGGDIEFFHRLVSKGFLLLYDPAVLVRHAHRKNFKSLKRQIADNGRGFGCYLLTCRANRSVSRWVLLKFFLYDWLLKWNLRNIFFRKSKIPLSLSLAELRGMCGSPLAYIKSRTKQKKMEGANRISGR